MHGPVMRWPKGAPPKSGPLLEIPGAKTHSLAPETRKRQQDAEDAVVAPSEPRFELVPPKLVESLPG